MVCSGSCVCLYHAPDSASHHLQGEGCYTDASSSEHLDHKLHYMVAIQTILKIHHALQWKNYKWSFLIHGLYNQAQEYTFFAMLRNLQNFCISRKKIKITQVQRPPSDIQSASHYHYWSILHALVERILQLFWHGYNLFSQIRDELTLWSVLRRQNHLYHRVFGHIYTVQRLDYWDLKSTVHQRAVL